MGAPIVGSDVAAFGVVFRVLRRATSTVMARFPDTTTARGTGCRALPQIESRHSWR